MMSRLYVCLGLTLASAAATAQSMLDPGLQWNIGRASAFSPDVTTTRYRIGGEVVVDDTTWRQVTSTNTEDGGDFTPTSILLREDGRGRVFGRTPNPGGVGLLYDFTAEVGDTLRLYNPYYNDSNCELVVLATGDTVLADGITRRTYRTVEEVGLGPTATAIEGLGSLNDGLFGQVCLTDAGDLLRCAYSGGEVLLNPRGGDCFVSPAAEVHAVAAGKAYPSPFADYLQLDFAEAGGTSYRLLDARGAVVLAGGLSLGRSRVTTGVLPEGIYVIVVQLAGGGVATARVIKR